jgi:hypothetical protein
VTKSRAASSRREASSTAGEKKTTGDHHAFSPLDRPVAHDNARAKPISSMHRKIPASCEVTKLAKTKMLPTTKMAAIGSNPIRTADAIAEQPAVPTNSILVYSPKSESPSGSVASVGSVVTISTPRQKSIPRADPRWVMLLLSSTSKYRSCNRNASALLMY